MLPRVSEDASCQDNGWFGFEFGLKFVGVTFSLEQIALDAALFQTTLIGIMNVLFTIISMRFIDKIGRKKLMLIGAAGMTVCYIIIGYLFQIERTEDWMLLTFIILTPF